MLVVVDNNIFYLKLCRGAILDRIVDSEVLSIKFTKHPASNLRNKSRHIIGHGRDGFPTYPDGISVWQLAALATCPYNACYENL